MQGIGCLVIIAIIYFLRDTAIVGFFLGIIKFILSPLDPVFEFLKGLLFGFLSGVFKFFVTLIVIGIICLIFSLIF